MGLDDVIIWILKIDLNSLLGKLWDPPCRVDILSHIGISEMYVQKILIYYFVPCFYRRKVNIIEIKILLTVSK